MHRRDSIHADDDPQIEPIPPAITAATAAVFDTWERKGPPRFACYRIGSRLVWDFMDRMKVGDHEQAQEYRVRLARSAVRRYRRTHRPGDVKLAARHIAFSRYHASASLLLRGIVPTESMLPFSRPEGE